MSDMSKRKSDTTKEGRRACIKCDLPAVEALRLDETTLFPVPLCRNHVRKARKYEEDKRITDRELQRAKLRDGCVHGVGY